MKMIRREYAFSSIAMLFLAGNTLAGPNVSVSVDKIVYAPGEAGEATVEIDATDRPATLNVYLEYGMDRRDELKTVPVPEKEKLVIPFTPRFQRWGGMIRAELSDEDGMVVATAKDEFVVGTNNYRLGQQSSHGGTYGPERVKEFRGENSYWYKQWKATKGTWLETFCALPSEFSGLVPEWDQWITMQSGYRSSKATLRAYTDTAHNLGMKVMIYNNAAPSGWLGARWARTRPEWLSYTYMGNMRADLSLEDAEKMKSWHKRMEYVGTPPEPREIARNDGVPPFLPLYINCFDIETIKFGCDQMLGACKELGYDGVRFDGHWILGDVSSGIGYDMWGRRPNRGNSLDQTNARILTDMKKYLWSKKEDFHVGFNYGSNYEAAGQRSPRAYKAACSNGGMILWEGAMHGDAFSDWRIGAAKLRECALRVHQNGGCFYGQIYLLYADKYPANDFSVRYYYITNFAATSHIYAGLYPGHECYLPIQNLYCRFALRYAGLLYDEKLQPIKEPEKQLNVTVGGKDSDDLWWKLYTYKRPLEGKYQIITHLVNMPAPGITKEQSTPDKQPAPMKDLTVKFAKRPSRIFLLDPEAKNQRVEIPAADSVTIPQLDAWKILVLEYPGTCDGIVSEKIWEPDFKGKDVIPDTKDGKVFLPITLFLTGMEGGEFYSMGKSTGRLIDDPEAMFGYALRCFSDQAAKPTRVIFGPHHSMPTMAPGKVRVTWRMKVNDNTGDGTVCEVEGRFGREAIKTSDFELANTYQTFEYGYTLKEDETNYFILNFHGGGPDLIVDSITMQGIERQKDQDLFSKASLDVSGRPAREGVSRKVHLLCGLWYDFFGLDGALKERAMQATRSWESLTTDHANIPPDYATSVEELWQYDMIGLLNAGADSLQAKRRKDLREYVMRGGTLFVGGGARAYGHGGYDSTFLAEILPVQVHRFDLTRVDGDKQIITPRKSSFLKDLSMEDQPRVNFYHDVRIKPGAEVILEAGGVPILTARKVGKGTVFAMTGTPMGIIEDGTPWWKSKSWKDVMLRVLDHASPPGAPSLKEIGRLKLPIVAKLSGIGEIKMVDADENVIEPVICEGVEVTEKGISFAANTPFMEKKGALAYPADLIRRRGSISFTISPGFKMQTSQFQDKMKPSYDMPLFSTRLQEGGNTGFDINLHVRELGGETMAMNFYIHAKDRGGSERKAHYAIYGVYNITHGGLRTIKKSIWKKGEEYNIEIKWSPSQMAMYENGEKMSVADFAPEMELGEEPFQGVLFIGSGSAGAEMSRVIMKNIVIRGE